ncbi:NAD(P)/FAD-dependent oxidoreductase [Variovorax sp. JS1663]|uniref:NAD(P)/FAD-dependent oxidoreductase n=1 Tax=Variovorax sp. JS1663 TaxID=1851577 RepID=UPI0013026E48|nr:FAD-binding oxidoreductase [Variovorax sp. JS1663]
MPIAASPSVWEHTATSPRIQGAAPAGDVHVETAVVGAGFTGLSAAHHLWKAGRECLVLDANAPGWGASGRNGGMAVLRYKTGFAALARKYGAETTLGLHGLIQEAVDTLESIVTTHRIPCSFRRCGHLTAASSEAALAALREDVQWLRAHAGDDVPRILEYDEMARVSGTAVYRGGYVDPRAAGIHPLDYARGLASALQKAGVRIHGQSPVERIDRSGDGYRLVTRGAVVKARRVILATNAYTDLEKLGFRLAQRIVPVASSVIATAPLTDAQRSAVLPQGHLLTDTRKLTNYFRVTPDGRLLFGGRGDLLGRDVPASFRGLEDLLAATYPMLKDVAIEHRWSGKVAVTLDDFPHLGELAPGVFFAIGYGGRGVALSQLLGRLVAAMACGSAVAAGPMSGASFRPIPLHGLRVPGMQAVATWYRWRDLLSARQDRAGSVAPQT